MSDGSLSVSKLNKNHLAEAALIKYRILIILTDDSFSMKLVRVINITKAQSPGIKKKTVL
jgi:hypothetical protein